MPVSSPSLLSPQRKLKDLMVLFACRQPASAMPVSSSILVSPQRKLKDLRVLFACWQRARCLFRELPGPRSRMNPAGSGHRVDHAATMSTAPSRDHACDGLAVVPNQDSTGFANRCADVACAWCQRWRGPLAKDDAAPKRRGRVVWWAELRRLQGEDHLARQGFCEVPGCW